MAELPRQPTATAARVDRSPRVISDQPEFPTVPLAIVCRFRYLRDTPNSPLLYGGWPLPAAFFVLDHLNNAASQASGTLTLEAKLTAIVAPRLETMGFELVRVAVLGRERPTVQIMADRADGSLISVEDCEQISHYLGTLFDVEDPIPGAWNLEVSSAGIDRPLTRAKDWNRFAGHLARVETLFPVGGRKRFSGIVLGADDKCGKLRLDDGTEAELPLHDIRRAKLVLTDALIAFTAPSPTTN